MDKFDIKKYIGDKKDEYLDPFILVTILEDVTSISFSEQKDFIEAAEVTIKEEDIKQFLDECFERENPELRRRMQESKQQKSPVNLGKMTKEDIEASADKFVDELEASKYMFSPDTLNYFKNYIDILKPKCLLLFDIIEKIANKEIESIKEQLVDLDIRLDEVGNISSEDVTRLARPTVYNFCLLSSNVRAANEVSTYLTFCISKDRLYRDGFSSSELYPCSSLQVKKEMYGDMNGYIPLSDFQKKKLEDENRKYFSEFVEYFAQNDIAEDLDGEKKMVKKADAAN